MTKGTKDSKARSLWAVTRQLFISDWGKALTIAVGWQLLMTVFGILVDTSLNVFKHTVYPISLLSHTYHWDGGWYMQILHGQYSANRAAAVFYPLFPTLVWLLHYATFGLLGYLAAGLVVNTLALWLVLVALRAISKLLLGDVVNSWMTVLIFLTSPAAIFLHMFYSEAVFCAVAFWAYLFALRNQWWKMGILLAISTAARLPSVLVIGLCALEFLRAHDWNVRRVFNRQILWFLLAPLGVISFGIYLHMVQGDFLGMIHGYSATKDWAYQKFDPNIIHTLYVTFRECAQFAIGHRPFDQLQFVDVLLPAVGLIILFAASTYLLVSLKKDGIPLTAFGYVSIIFFTLNSNVVSVNRYLLPCLPLYTAAALLYRRTVMGRSFVYGVIYSGILLQAYLFILFVSDFFAG